MKTQIQKLKQIVAEHPSGHLPLKYRIQLARQINDPRILNKIYFECAKKVFPIWEDEYSGKTPVYDMLKKVNEFLYQNKGQNKDFIKLADKYKNYVESINSEAGAAGLAALYLCYSICTDAAFDEEYNDIDDDDVLDYEEWKPDFYASIAYSKGNPFNENGDIEKRREFWLWFLNIINAGSEYPIIPFAEKSFDETALPQIQRTQSYNTPSIRQKIDYCIETTLKLLAEHHTQWDTFLLKGYCMQAGNRYNTFAVHNAAEIECIFGDLEIIQAFADIKKEMYRQAPNEGAWCQCWLTVNKEKEYTLRFNYDDKNEFSETGFTPSRLEYEFRTFPRSKAFTPKWWQTILGKKAKYLE